MTACRQSAALLAAALALTACEQPSTSAADANAADTDAVVADVGPSLDSSAPTENAVVPADLSGPQDPRSIVEAYFAAITAGEPARAYAFWDARAASMTQAEFEASLPRYRSYKAEVGRPGRIDSGAGNRYVEVPVRITAVLAEDGRHEQLAGTLTLHRSVIEGGDPRWRIRGSDLRPAVDSVEPPPPPAADAPNFGNEVQPAN